MKTICVFCSSSNKAAKPYFDAARELGSLIAESGFALLYGGTDIGLMGAAANAAMEKGGRVVGIIPQKIFDKGIGHKNLDELIITETIQERKALMEKRSDAFIALPGGFGTLEELMEILTLRQLKYHHKPVVLLNTGGFYNHLTEHFEMLYRENFAREDYRVLYYLAQNAAEALNYIEHFRLPEIAEKWF